HSSRHNIGFNRCTCLHDAGRTVTQHLDESMQRTDVLVLVFCSVPPAIKESDTTLPAEPIREGTSRVHQCGVDVGVNVARMNDAAASIEHSYAAPFRQHLPFRPDSDDSIVRNCYSATRKNLALLVHRDHATILND